MGGGGGGASGSGSRSLAGFNGGPGAGLGSDQFEGNLALNLNPGSSLHQVDAQEMSAATSEALLRRAMMELPGETVSAAAAAAAFGGGHWAGLSGALSALGTSQGGRTSPHGTLNLSSLQPQHDMGNH